MNGGEYTVYNWSDVDSPSIEVRRTIQTLTMEVSQIMKVRWFRVLATAWQPIPAF